MNPVAFSILGLTIRWYGIFIAAGMVLGIVAAEFNCKWRKIDYDTFLSAILIALPLGVIGARLYYVVFEFNNYKDNIIQVFNLRQGGLAIHGGVIFAVISALIYANYKKINFMKLADVAAPSMILGQAVGRWGNFFNQETHGGPVSYEYIKHFPLFIQKGMNIGGTYYHPTFLYESIWDFSTFLIMMCLLRKSKRKGIVFFTYIGLYSIGRFFIEGLRTDSLMLGPVRAAQLVSLLGVMMWVGFFVFTKCKKAEDF